MRGLNVSMFLTTLLSFTICFFSSGVLGFAITGVPGPTQHRREIRDLKNQYPNQFNIFLLAYQRLKSGPPDGDTSYYGMTRVHGVPPAPWDGVGRMGPGTGFCTHNSNQFNTWHRVYLALFEQRLVKAAQLVANEFPAATRAQWVGAANLLRLPYFDWAGYGVGSHPLFPQIFSDETVSVMTPTGQKTITNPLRSYVFPNRNIFAPYWNQYPRLVRYPTTATSAAVSNEQGAENTFAAQVPQQRNSLFMWFMNCKNYLETANDLRGNYISPSCTIDLELLHNNIHRWVGGVAYPMGHMSIIPYGSYDPVFWFHHANVDRIFAMWQALYPAQRMPAQAQQNSTYAIPAGSTQNENSPLYPFRKNAAGQFWTTAQVYDFRTFNYTYPDFDGGSSPAVINQRIRNLYGPGSGPGRAAKRDDRAHSLFQATQLSNGSYAQYVAKVVTPRYALGGGYNVFIFLGEPTTDDVATWSYDPNIVGLVPVFADDDQADPNVMYTGIAPLSDSIAERLISAASSDTMSILSEPVVVPYLKKKLTWKITGPKNELVDPHTLKGFSLKVYRTTLDLPEDETQFATYTAPVNLPDVTRDKAGGYSGPPA